METENAIDERLRRSILDSSIFPTPWRKVSFDVSPHEHHLRKIAIMDLIAEGRLREFPGYLLQASGDEPHQLPLPCFEAEQQFQK